jgi:hypothetical protein
MSVTNYHNDIQPLIEAGMIFYPGPYDFSMCDSFQSLAQEMLNPEAFAIVMKECDRLDAFLPHQITNDDSIFNGLNAKSAFLIHELTLRYSCYVRFDLACYGPLKQEHLDLLHEYAEIALNFSPTIFVNEGWGSPWDFVTSNSADFVTTIAGLSIETDEGLTDLDDTTCREQVFEGIQSLCEWYRDTQACGADVAGNLVERFCKIDREDDPAAFADAREKMKSIIGDELLAQITA